MSHFFETILSDDIDYLSEINKIDTLFWHRDNYFLFDNAGRESLGAFIDEYFFRKLRISHNYISLKDFLSDIKKSTDNYADRFIYYSEAVLSVIQQYSRFKPNVEYQQDINFIVEIIEDINKVISVDLDTLNLEPKQIENKLGEIYTIIPKNQTLERALTIVDDRSIRMHLIEYCSSKNNHNIKAKTEILRLIANYVEGFTKNKELRQLNERLFDDTDFLYNNLDLRHNVEVKDKKFYEKTLPSREKWLDITYNESLLVICSKQEKKDHIEIKKMRSEVE